ncbi:MAG TPA: oligoendopeptidase F [Anaerolineaceae bacterium]
MATTVVRQRSEIPVEYTWNAPSLFENLDAWKAELKVISEEIPAMQSFQGRLSEGPGVLLEAVQLMEILFTRAGKLLVYGTLSAATDTANPEGAQMEGMAYALLGQFAAAVAFIDPELIAIGQETLNAWMMQEPKLQTYAHYFDNLFRKQEHVRSAEVEELLGMLTSPFSGTNTTATMLTDADFRFEPATASDGTKLPVTQGTLDEILSGSDREARRTAWESYMDTFLNFRNTLSSNLSTSINQMVFRTRARRYGSTLEASLAENNIPKEVFFNLIETFKKNLPTWHRYWAVRRKLLGVETLHPYDIWAPLTKQPLKVPFQQAFEWVSAAVKPLGEDYVAALRQGVLHDRWIDVYPSQGKASAQFSAGWYGTFPFIFLNYDDTIFSASTLAHELGHSMHSYLTWKTQPAVYSDYSLFVAEVASNFHQAMMRGYLLANNSDPDFQISVIEEGMSNFHRYFFIMPTLARFELEMHERAEQGEGLTAEIMNTRMVELFSEGYGSEMHVDPDRVGITWATFGHLYADYYVYQYATGISAANALSRRILAGEPGAAENYRKFLSSGSSLYPLDALKVAGVDMTTTRPVEEAFQVLSDLVDRLEKLAG